MRSGDLRDTHIECGFCALPPWIAKREILPRAAAAGYYLQVAVVVKCHPTNLKAAITSAN